MTAVDTTTERDVGLRADLARAAEVLAKVTLVGALSGVLAVGVLARFAMALLAFLNAHAAGVTSDDGFTIGQFTLYGSLQLAASGLQFGIIGAFFYLALRGLMVGPDWFRLLSISLGPAVVIGAIVVHTEGVDFRVLDPVWLAAGLFVLVPGAYCAMLHVFSERVLRPGRDLPRTLLVLGLLPWVLLLPLTLLLLGGFLAARLVRGASGAAWLARGVLAALFVFSVVDLAGDIETLT
jgi:hypothetical protein